MPEAPAKAPDPATITFGTNKPIVAPPPAKPAGSGLRFSGPSDGELQSSGPQQTSLKAEGLTFSSAASSPAQSESQAATAKPKSEAGGTAKVKTDKGQAEPPVDKRSSSAKAAPNDRKTDEKSGAKADESDGKAARKSPAVTKPAIAPQQHGPRIEKTPPRRTGAFALFSLGMAAVGLLLWFASQSGPNPRSGSEPAVPSAALESKDEGEGIAADATAKPDPEAPAPAAESNERAEMAKAEEPAAANAPAGLTAVELAEVQGLLRRLSLDPGEASGELTEATRQAIRSYQEMAGLPADGEATPALLQELRAVVSLYQGG
ncbi:peptidoglycan-binding protein [Pelagibius sp.]|uniref:peptidoglycan-binding domain-containing protein n=1 Tax=Pelagibius sp. TaxID=1931238 RepID=UPI00261E7EFC|nr:peptidoglycan-binding domain-containing protein [Pelagibius sp.]